MKFKAVVQFIQYQSPGKAIEATYLGIKMVQNEQQRQGQIDKIAPTNQPGQPYGILIP